MEELRVFAESRQVLRGIPDMGYLPLSLTTRAAQAAQFHVKGLSFSS